MPTTLHPFTPAMLADLVDIHPAYEHAPLVVAGHGRVVMVTRAALMDGAPALVLYLETEHGESAPVPMVEPTLPFTDPEAGQ